MPRPPSRLATILPAKIINRPPRQYPGKKWIIPLGAKAEATSLKASVSRQRGGNVRKTYTDGIDKVRSRTPSLRRFPRPACRRTGGLAYGRWRDSINFVETPTSQGSCAKKRSFSTDTLSQSAPDELLPLTPTLATTTNKAAPNHLILSIEAKL